MFKSYLTDNTKYTKWYISIVDNALSKNRNKTDNCYYELHHILPKSMYPEFNKSNWNLVLLTAREHFICHYLLYKIYKNHKMSSAFMKLTRMSKGQKRYINSRLYEKIKIEHYKLHSEFMMGNKFNPGLKGIDNPFYSRSHSDETKLILREKALKRFEINGSPRTGIAHSDETKAKISNSKKGQGLGLKRSDNCKLAISEALTGKPKSEKHRKKLSEARKGIIPNKFQCPHCDKKYDAGNLAKHLKRYHTYAGT